MKKAAFALGCFWHAQEEFDKFKGIVKTEVGYAGGHKDNPTYYEVSSGTTGHAETIEIEYNEDEISYEKLLEVFWKIHDPTTLNRQGADVGTQYRSIIFYYDEEQKREAEKSLEEKQKKFNRKIVTEIKPMEKFWRAEEYHQKYYMK